MIAIGPRLPWVALLILSACGGSSGDGDDPPPDDDSGISSGRFLIGHPAQRSEMKFGETTRALDFYGDGVLEIAIGAPEEGAVYLAQWTGTEDEPAWIVTEVLNAAGEDVWPVTRAKDLFGVALAVGQLDDDPADELVVGAAHAMGDAGIQGAGAVFIYGLMSDPREPVVLSSPWEEAGHFGTGLQVGDVDVDGHNDVAVGAPWVRVDGLRTGALSASFGPFPSTESIQIVDPFPVKDGNFGVHLAFHEGPSGNGLIVSAMGNTSTGGSPKAGQVFHFHVPLDPSGFVVAEDPEPDPEDPSRFGMHISSRQGFLTVGAPRKDVGGVVDSGMGFVFDEGGAGRITQHQHSGPEEEDILGYRCGLADIVGDAELDFLFLSLQQALFVWSGDDRMGPARLAVKDPPDAGDHHGMGFSVAQLIPGGRDEVILGDPTWDREGMGKKDDSGRVLVVWFD